MLRRTCSVGCSAIEAATHPTYAPTLDGCCADRALLQLETAMQMLHVVSMIVDGTRTVQRPVLLQRRLPQMATLSVVYASPSLVRAVSWSEQGSGAQSIAGKATPKLSIEQNEVRRSLLRSR